MTRRTLCTVFLIATAGYFATALYLTSSFVDPRPAGRTVIQLMGPYEKFGHANISRGLAALDGVADDPTMPYEERSPLLIYEDGKLLGPAHSRFEYVRDQGAGRFGHWSKYGLIFSSSDNSDPHTNGNRYWAVLP
jgi:hypothetical protein